MTKTRIRLADHQDIEQLIELEEQSFASDRISRRSWRALSKSASAIVLVAEAGAMVVGSAVILMRKRSQIARLYSIAVKCGCQRSGIGHLLTNEVSRAATAHGCTEVRLESRIDNVRAHALFRALGYTPFGAPIRDYYADGASAIRFRKQLRPDIATKAAGRNADNSNIDWNQAPPG
ncbi:GNAT family N-acetyltransferase [Eoetvoesiella caeni]|jgi:ribosomal protein S18 acetylase RimI-like enzyme|nr:N-acetyltransferase [Eoetvoesiella caeni]MCI2810507.1 GNAT family N-acetyltransferase [Eoetvoesiella caeni]NYT54821.1 GNAT family N-acetyltransferase [Eoetvoesiella caeni]